MATRKKTSARNTTPITPQQGEFLALYRQLETKLGRTPTLIELGTAAGYAHAAAGAQRMRNQLISKGLVAPVEQVIVGGETTELGRAALRKLRGRR